VPWWAISISTPQASRLSTPIAAGVAKYRINPGNVGRGAKRDEQFATLIEMACRYDKPVRIGVNWAASIRSCLRAHGRERAGTEPVDSDT